MIQHNRRTWHYICFVVDSYAQWFYCWFQINTDIWLSLNSLSSAVWSLKPLQLLGTEFFDILFSTVPPCLLQWSLWIIHCLYCCTTVDTITVVGLRIIVVACSQCFSSTTTKTMTKMTKTFWIIVDETKTKTKIRTRDENDIKINSILVLTTLTRISKATFGTSR